ncbi:hypothetical protein [Streptomyces sasae]|uniref:hypothetical protein n=1 Tax=Streptomyces sasae TaxID=1266772 RepID=UPI00292E8C2A|nr:hypothetical protein [Streptomyces sasae]
MSHPDHPTSAGAARRRDRGLRRIGNTTSWVAAAAAVGSVALAAGYAYALPGKSAPPLGNTSRPSVPEPTPSPSTTPRAPRSAAPARTPVPPSRTAPHTTVRQRRAAPAITHSAAPASTKPPAATPQPSHTTSGAS